MRIMFFLSVLPFYLMCQAANINGTYVNEFGDKIILSDSEFIYIENQSHFPVWYNDTLAVCNVKKINSNLFEINSIDNSDIQNKSIEISHFNNYSKDDSIKISFEIPFPLRCLHLSINTDLGVYSNTNGENYIYIPRETKQYILSAWKEPVTTHTVIGQSFGVIRFDSKPLQIDNHGDILLKIPFLDSGFFERYSITGEFFYLKGKKIYWKGSVYKRRNNF